MNRFNMIPKVVCAEAFLKPEARDRIEVFCDDTQTLKPTGHVVSHFLTRSKYHKIISPTYKRINDLMKRLVTRSDST